MRNLADLNEGLKKGDALVQVRNATEADLPQIMEVEAEWPEGQRASAEKFRSRLSRFPQGLFVALCDERIVGVSTSCLTRYDPQHLDWFSSWSAVTNDGYLPLAHEVKEANALYIVSTGVLRAFRQRRVAETLVRHQAQLSARCGLEYCVSGSLITGYDKYCRTRGEISAADYVFTRYQEVPVDRAIRVLEEIGFMVPDARHVLANYYPSPHSRDYSALVVYRNAPRRASPTDQRGS